MLFVDEFCGIYIYIKFGADVTSQYVSTVGLNEEAIRKYIKEARAIRLERKRKPASLGAG